MLSLAAEDGATEFDREAERPGRASPFELLEIPAIAAVLKLPFPLSNDKIEDEGGEPIMALDLPKSDGERRAAPLSLSILN